MRWVKFFTLLAILTFASLSWSAETFFGIIQKTAVNPAPELPSSAFTYSLVDERGRYMFNLEPRDADTSKQLAKLNTGDLLSATGTLTQKSHMIVDSIDFVGLKKLLGLWKSEESVFNFKDFSTVQFYSLSDPDPQDAYPSNKIKLYNFKYSLGPSSGDTWKLFFTDDRSVILTSIEFQKNSAKLMVFDSETGEERGTINLQKIK
jgi:hypothetical protein